MLKLVNDKIALQFFYSSTETVHLVKARKISREEFSAIITSPTPTFNRFIKKKKKVLQSKQVNKSKLEKINSSSHSTDNKLT